MTTIYIDILVCLNVIVNYFLLLASGKFLSRPYKRWRILLGAFLGGLYSLYILLPQLAQWFTILVELAMAATITLTAFGRKGILKTCSCFFAMSFLFAGSMFLLWKTAAPKNLIINNGVVYFSAALNRNDGCFLCAGPALSEDYRKSGARGAVLYGSGGS